MGALRAGFPFRNQGLPAGVGIFAAVTLFIDRLLLISRLDLIALATVGLLLIYRVNADLRAIVTYWGRMLGRPMEAEMRRKAFDQTIDKVARWLREQRFSK